MVLIFCFIISPVYAALSDGLVAYYTFDASNLTNDTSGNDYRAVATVGVVQNRGKMNNSYLFGSSNKYISYNDTILDRITMRNFTILLWYNATTSQSDDGVLNIGPFDGSLNGPLYFAVPSGAGGTMRVRLNNNGTLEINQGYAGNTWNFYVFVYNGTEMTTYSNATANSRVTGITPYIDLNVSTYKMVIGGYYSTSYCWAKNIDEIGIWNRSLTPTEISTLYNGSSGYYYKEFWTTSDPCTCSAGANWKINTQNCTLSSSCNLYPYNVSVYSPYTLTISPDVALIVKNILLENGSQLILSSNTTNLTVLN